MKGRLDSHYTIVKPVDLINPEDHSLSSYDLNGEHIQLSDLAQLIHGNLVSLAFIHPCLLCRVLYYNQISLARMRRP